MNIATRTLAKRWSVALALIGLALGVIGCVGDTDPATNITNLSAELNAHGHADNGPAYWWWEYSTSQSAVQNGNGTQTPRQGPASSSRDVKLRTVVTALTPNTTYHFRVCGQDQSSSSAVCGHILSFKTLAGTSYAFDRKWGSHGSANGQFDFPQDIATGPSGDVYVSDYSNARIQKFTPTGSFITKWGTQGSGNGQFSGPEGVATDSAGNVYVVELAGHRVQKFSSAGAFITKWGGLGSADGKFQYPWDAATDSAGNVYVGDQGNNWVQKFTSAGAFIGKWGSLGPDDVGSADGQFDHPAGVAIDPAGRVYVVDRTNYRIQKFTATGSFITKWGTAGSGDGQFGIPGPSAVAIDSAGGVFVADSYNDRIQKFDSTGGFVIKWGARGSGNGQFFTPTGVATDALGNVYVVDENNNRIQKFKPSR